MKRILFLSLLFSLTVTSLYCKAFDQNGQGIKAVAMSAFLALADDASAIYHNPAGLSRIKNTGEILLGGMFISHRQTNTMQKTPFAGDKTETNGLFAIPCFYSAYKLSPNLTLGAAYYIPYGGGGADFKDAYDFRAYMNGYEEKYDFKGYMFGNAGTLSVAYQFNEVFSAGIGATYYYVIVKGESKGQNLGGTPHGDTKQDLSGSSYSGNFGFLMKPTANLSLGLAVRLPSTVKVKGNFTIENSTLPSVIRDGTYDMELTMRYPLNIGGGLAYQLTDAWLVTFDVLYQDWSNSREQDYVIDLQFMYSSGSNKYGYTDGFRFSTGTEYKVNPSLALRAGFSYNPAVAQTGYLGYDNMDLDMFSLSLGAGIELVKSLVLDTAIYGVYYPKRTQNGTIPYPNNMAAGLFGEISKLTLGGGLQLKYMF